MAYFAVHYRGITVPAFECIRVLTEVLQDKEIDQLGKGKARVKEKNPNEFL